MEERMKIKYYKFTLIIIVLSIIILSACAPKAPIIGNIQFLDTIPDPIMVGHTIRFGVEVENPDNLDLSFTWRCSTGGTFNPVIGEKSTHFTVPDSPGNHLVTLEIDVLNKRLKGFPVSRELQIPVKAPPAPFNVESEYIPSGYMGDGETYGEASVKITDAVSGGQPCLSIEYIPKSTGWAGVYWLKGASFDRIKGAKDLTGYKKITWMAKAADSRDAFVQFKVGGIDNPGLPFKDSCEAATRFIGLTTMWQKYEINLIGQDLSSVVGGFCWIAKGESHPKGLKFYLKDIYFQYEGTENDG
jgi:hypothetical protein